MNLKLMCRGTIWLDMNEIKEWNQSVIKTTILSNHSQAKTQWKRLIYIECTMWELTRVYIPQDPVLSKNEALHYVLCKYILQCRIKTQKKRGKSFYNRKVTGSQIDQEMRYS